MTTPRHPNGAGTSIGVYLPSILPGTGASTAAAWARRTEDLGFGAVAVTNEGADDGAQPLQVATRVARDTSCVTIVSDIVAGSTWNPWAHAEHMAFLDGLAGDRHLSALTVPAGDAERLDRLRAARTTLPPNGVRTPLLLGGPAEDQADPIARHARGWFHRTSTPEAFAAGAARVRAAWTGTGAPLLVAAFHVALGEAAQTAARAQHARLDAVHGSGSRTAAIAAGATTEDGVRDRIAALAAAGADLVLVVPAIADLHQLDRIAAAALPTVATTTRGPRR